MESRRILICKRTWFLEHQREPFEIFATGDFDSAEARRDRGEHLDIKQAEPAVAQMFDEVVECDFGSIAHAMEHGFACEKASDSDAINPADKFVVLPAFETMGVTLLVQLRVGFKELAGDPGATTARARSGTAFHHLNESAINCYLEYAFANDFGEAVGDVELIEFKNSARIRRPPRDGLVGPGENAAAISKQQSRNGQVAANRYEAFSVGTQRAGEDQAFIEKDGHAGKR